VSLYHRLTVELPYQTGMRADSYLALTGMITRSQIKARKGQLVINGKPRKLSFNVQNDDVIEISLEDIVSDSFQAEDIPVNVLFENERVIVLNKAQGLVVHPGAGNRSGTLVNALLARRNIKETGDFISFRPFIVHRLDKDTSGVLIAAWDSDALEFLQRQFRERTVKKRYIAITRGAPVLEQGVIDAPLARDIRNRKRFAVAKQGKIARTHYRLIKRWILNDGTVYSLLLLSPQTGRTHQIRVHLKYIGCPVLGDPIYGDAGRCFPHTTLALHAKKLSIKLPGEDKMSVFRAPVPERFKEIIKSLSLRRGFLFQCVPPREPF
jgi:23S rRNA pseudouridine1911/1915/1917 synthase